MQLVERFVPVATAAQRRQGLLVAQAYLHSLGITAWQDAWVTPADFDTYADLATSGELTARVVGAMWWERSRGLEQIDELIAQRARGPIGRFAPTSVKIMLDGVCETFTAAMLTPYLDGHGHPTGNTGLSFISGDGAARDRDRARRRRLPGAHARARRPRRARRPERRRCRHLRERSERRPAPDRAPAGRAPRRRRRASGPST